MFIVYEINQALPKYQSEDTDYLLDAFQKIFVEDLKFISLCKDLEKWTQQSVFMDSGDWSRGYTTYFDLNSRNKYLVVDLELNNHNHIIKSLIRDYKIKFLD